MSRPWQTRAIAIKGISLHGHLLHGVSGMARIDPIILFVSRFDECLEFYRDVLGLEPTTKEGPVHEEFVELDAGGLTFSLHGGYEGKVHGGRPVALHFEVEDIFETVKRLRDLGHEVGEPQKMEYGVYETSFRDPDGNEFDLTQPL